MYITTRFAEQLEKFKLNWGGIKLTQYEDKLVYKVVPSYSRRSAQRANELIEELGLELTAIPNNNYPEDSFYVTKK